MIIVIADIPGAEIQGYGFKKGTAADGQGKH